LEATFYPGTVHGFLQQDRADLYRAAEADDSWRRAMAWLDRYVPRP
jgi:dienelactone hydrolase